MSRSIDLQNSADAGSGPVQRPPVPVPFGTFAVRRVWCIVGVDDEFQRELARQLIARGLPTVVTAPHESALADFARFENALPITAETRRRDEVAAAIAACETTFGAVDVLVESPSLLRDEAANATPSFQRPSRMLAAVLPGMRRRHAGSIVRLWPSRRWDGHVDAFDDALRRELAPDGIRLTTVEAGPWYARPATFTDPFPPGAPTERRDEACDAATRLAVLLIDAIHAGSPPAHVGLADVRREEKPAHHEPAALHVDRTPTAVGLLAMPRLPDRR